MKSPDEWLSTALSRPFGSEEPSLTKIWIAAIQDDAKKHERIRIAEAMFLVYRSLPSGSPCRKSLESVLDELDVPR